MWLIPFWYFNSLGMLMNYNVSKTKSCQNTFSNFFHISKFQNSKSKILRQFKNSEKFHQTQKNQKCSSSHPFHKYFNIHLLYILLISHVLIIFESCFQWCPIHRRAIGMFLKISKNCIMFEPLLHLQKNFWNIQRISKTWIIFCIMFQPMPKKHPQKVFSNFFKNIKTLMIFLMMPNDFTNILHFCNFQFYLQITS